MENHIVSKEIQLNASAQRVWNALTNPEKTKKYFFKCKVFSDWKAGSPIVFKRRLLFIFNFELRGKILQIEPGKFLKYTLKNSRSDTESIVTDKLTSVNGKTVLSITDDVGQGKGAEKRYRKSLKGWEKVLKGLKVLVESPPR